MKKKNFGTISRLTAAALLVSTLASPLGAYSANAATSDSTVKLRFMETTDLHDNVMDYDYFQDAPTIEYGLDRTAQLIKQARADKVNPADPNSQTYEQNSMLFDAGDLLQGNPMADYVARVKGLTAAETHPMFKAMSLLKYDAGIPGNHEFNYGLDYLNTALQHVPYNFVNANIYKDDHDTDATNDQNYFTPYKIIDKVVKDSNGVDQTIKVGVIGFAPPQIMEWDYDNLHGKVIAKDMVKTAQEFIPKMKAAGADVIVAIAHSGCDVAQADQDKAENAVYALTKVPGIDALLFGHAHVNFPGDAQFNNNNTIDNVNGHINNVPALEAGFWGNNLGVMDLELQKTDGKWTVSSSKAALRPLTTKDASGKKISTVTGPDQQIVDAVKATHEGTLAYVRGKIGLTSAPLYSFFAQVQDDPTIQIVNNAQTDYVKKWIDTKSPDLKGLPILSAGAPFKAGGRSGPTYYTNIPAGELSIKSANDLYLYPNTLKAVQVTGATVREWLEMSAGQFNTVDPTKSEPQNIVNDAFPSYNFDVIDGVKYQIDITQKPRYDKNGVVINPDSHRIVKLTMRDGTPLKDDQQFIVVTNNYRAGGGGNFPGLKGGIGKIVINSPDESRQVLINYIAKQGTVNPSADQNWKFATVGGSAKLVFNSSQDAKPFAAASTNIKDLGANADGSGFEQYLLDQSDRTAPEAPILEAVTDKSTNVIGTTEAGATIDVKANGTSIGAATAGDDGKFSVPIPTQKAGTKISVTATDDAENVSKATEVTVQDKTAPSKPVVNEVRDTDKKITGTAEKGSVVTVKAGSKVLGTVVAKNGKFSVTLKSPQKAGTVLSLTASDSAKNVSQVTKVTVKHKKAPKEPKVNSVNIKSIQVTGYGEVGLTITVKVGSKKIGTAVVDKKGKFSIKIPKQKTGTILLISAKDKVSNESKVIKITVKK